MNDKLSFPLLDKDGFIIVDSVNSLSFKSLTNWIRLVLLNKAAGPGAYKEELPSSFLKRIFHQLDPKIRHAFQDAVLILLSEFAQTLDEEWANDNGDELLLLTGAVFRDTEREKEPVDLLLSMEASPKLKNMKQNNLHWRILQTLVALNYSPARTSFWIDQYERGNEQYALVIVAGLSIISLSKLFEWIKIVISDNSVIKALFNRLPFLVERYGIDTISSHLNSIIPCMRNVHFKELKELAEMLNLNMDSLLEKNVFIDWKNDDLFNLSKSLGLELPDLQIFPQRLALYIEDQLKKQYKKDIYQEDIPEEFEAIFEIIHIAEKKKIEIRKHDRDKLVKYVEACSRLDEIDEFDRNFLFYNLKNVGRNIINEITTFNGVVSYGNKASN
jgi:hypothetical protein